MFDKTRRQLEKMAAKGESVSEIAAALDIAEREIFFHLDSMDALSDMTFPAIIANSRKTWGKSLADYFRANAEKSFQDMAKDLGVAHSTVEQYYQIFTKSVGE